MGFEIEAIEIADPGIYDATIVDLKIVDTKFGQRLQVEFELEDNSFVNGFFQPKATPNNKTGKLVEKALGKFRSASSDELLGKKVKILIEEKQSNDKTYVNATDIL